MNTVILKICIFAVIFNYRFMTLRYILGPIALVLVSISLVCCTERTLPVLAEADAVMESRPDSALAILEGVDTAALDRESDKALYALLMTQAMVKTDRPIESDSLICVARDYFSEHGREFDRMRAYFYHGYILVMGNSNSYAQAIECAIPAYDISLSLDDDYWRAKCAELLADIYSNSYHYEEALEYRREAADYYNRAGKIANHRYSLADVAIHIGELGQCDNAINLLDSVRGLAANEPTDSVMMGFCDSSILEYLKLTGQNEKAYKVAKELYNNRAYPLNVNDYANLYSTFYVSGDTVLSEMCLEAADSMATNSLGNLSVFLNQVDVLYSQGHYKEAIAKTDSLLRIQSRAVGELLKESVMVSRGDYFSEKASEAQTRNRILILIVATISILGLVIIVCTIILSRSKLEAKEAQIGQKIAETESLSSIIMLKQEELSKLNGMISDNSRKIQIAEDSIRKLQEDRELCQTILSDKNNDIESKQRLLESLNEQIARFDAEIITRRESVSRLEANIKCYEESQIGMKAVIANLYRDQWKLMDTLFKEFDGLKDSDCSKAMVFKKVSDILKKTKDPDTLETIERSVNEYLDNVLVRIKETLPNLRTSDIYMLALLYAGFSPKAVSHILGKDLKYIYNRRLRIIGSLGDKCPDGDFHISLLK